MAYLDKIPGGGATEAEAGSDLGEAVEALFQLCRKIAEGDEIAKLGLETLGNMQRGIQSGLEAQQVIKAYGGILKAMTDGGAKAQEPKP